MEWDWKNYIKKLALAYRTGWEYMPDSEEAGSVLTDIFLEMEEENQKRIDKIWEKQACVFRQAVPENREEPDACTGELCVKAKGEENGKLLPKGTPCYILQEQGNPVWFRTLCPLRLTTAELQYAVYRRGLSAWLSYEKKEKGGGAVPLFLPVGEELCHPVFCWYFAGLCDGRKDFGFAVDFNGDAVPDAAPRGTWTVSDGVNTFPTEWSRTEEGFLFTGQTPEFVRNLDGAEYEVRLTLSAAEELQEEWLTALYDGFSLTAAAEEQEPDLCLTDAGAGAGGRVLPFGSMPEEAACLYLACDRIFAGWEGEIIMQFTESFEEEERLPAPQPEAYKKLYKKYPWLQAAQTVQDWRAEESCWEYFNGSMWRILPGSEAWMTGCGLEAAGEKCCRWRRPKDMCACAVEGEVHFYIRLRLVKVKNAYAAYYKKRIPVLEHIRFQAKKRRMASGRKKMPERVQAAEERMYLGFDTNVAPDNCWYTGEGFRCFEGGQIKGESIRFGKKAFWVELTEKKPENLPCLLSNYVPVQWILEGQEEMALKVEAGTVFYVEPQDAGLLEAVCLADIHSVTSGLPSLRKELAAEHYFAHSGRLLSPMDMELMLQERYPQLKISACSFVEKENMLQVELKAERTEKIAHTEETAHTEKTARTEETAHAEKNRYTEEEALQDALDRIEKCLQALVHRRGALWLRDCTVSCRIKED